MSYGFLGVLFEEFLPWCGLDVSLFHPFPDVLTSPVYIKIGTPRQHLPPEEGADFCRFLLELPQTVQNIIHVFCGERHTVSVGSLAASYPLIRPVDPPPHAPLSQGVANGTLRHPCLGCQSSV